MDLREIENTIQQLGVKDRAALAQWILQSLDDLSDAEIQKLWMEKSERRLDEMARGEVQEIPAEDVFQRARNAIS